MIIKFILFLLITSVALSQDDPKFSGETPNIVYTNYKLGVELESKRQTKPALKSYYKALSINPAFMPAIKKIVSLELKNESPDTFIKIEKLYKNALQVQPANIVLLEEYGDLLMRLNRIDEAIKYYSTIMMIDTDFHTFWNDKIIQYLRDN